MPLRYQRATDKTSRGGVARNLSRNHRGVANPERVGAKGCASRPKPVITASKIRRSRVGRRSHAATPDSRDAAGTGSTMTGGIGQGIVDLQELCQLVGEMRAPAGWRPITHRSPRAPPALSPSSLCEDESFNSRFRSVN